MQVQTVYNFGSLINLAIIILSFVAGGWILKSQLGKAFSDMQRDAITTMKDEIEVLRGKIDDLKTENKRLENIMQTICAALKIKGTIISVSGEVITIKDSHGEHVTRITESNHTVLELSKEECYVSPLARVKGGKWTNAR